MSLLFISIFYLLFATIDAAPSPTVLAATEKALPTCFPTRPHCIRPRAEECREATALMGSFEPGHPVILSRPEMSEQSSRSYTVPRQWASVPPNCVVKLDVTDPKASDQLFIKSLVIQGEIVIKKCIIGGTGCGGEILVGDRRVLRLTLAYYTAIKGFGEGVLMLGENGTVRVHVDG